MDNSEDYNFVYQSPIVLTLTQEELNYIAYGEYYKIGLTADNAMIPFAAYIPAGILLLRDSFNIETDKSHLLHELVHHFQASYQKKYRCLQEGELEAYALQKKYIEQYNLDPLEINDFTILNLSLCRD